MPLARNLRIIILVYYDCPNQKGVAKIVRAERRGFQTGTAPRDCRHAAEFAPN